VFYLTKVDAFPKLYFKLRLRKLFVYSILKVVLIFIRNLSVRLIYEQSNKQDFIYNTLYNGLEWKIIFFLMREECNLY